MTNSRKPQSEKLATGGGFFGPPRKRRFQGTWSMRTLRHFYLHTQTPVKVILPPPPLPPLKGPAASYIRPLHRPHRGWQ
jgi:hypothetical protein